MYLLLIFEHVNFGHQPLFYDHQWLPIPAVYRLILNSLYFALNFKKMATWRERESERE